MNDLVVSDVTAERIAQLHGEIMNCARTAVGKAIAIGGLLAKKKSELPRGGWLPWLKTLPFSRSTAHNYVNLFESHSDGKLPTVGTLKDAYRLVAGKSNRPVEVGCNQVIPILDGPAPTPDEPRVVTDLATLQGEKFGCIYADPPWRYTNQNTRGSTDNHYPTMTIDEICALPVREMAADRAHLHLWTTNAFLFECPKIFEAWGFEFKSQFVWAKPQMGMGNYWRNSHEIMLLGIRGGLVAKERPRSWLEAPRTRHSEKPDIVRELIEQMSPGPRLELFGRKPVPGWTVFGNQVARGYQPTLEFA